MHGVVDITPGATTTHPHGACPGIDMNVLDGRKVDDQAVIAHSQTAGIMAAASNGNPQIVFSSEMYRGHHVGYICALGNQTRFSIDHGVIDSAFFVVLLVGGLYQVPPQLTLEFTDILRLHIFLSLRQINRSGRLLSKRSRPVLREGTGGIELTLRAPAAHHRPSANHGRAS
jgi:hypothetical protein